MYLRSIELFGFKTFADRTVLEFGPGITGIVGPNGAGKSNIADAVLFVLGEQSHRTIRTSQLTDVIFHGSETRRPMGLAEVTLVLDNSDRTMAIPYTEVAITRRTHRSGESDYFINKTRCRLRDVLDLFVDTGLGRQAYSVIGQNEVDRILRYRAEERRALFDEAAGTARYRGRRNEALRKLEVTQANLTRINDIYAEVRGQLEPLADQARKAREYREVMARLRELSLGVLAAGARSASAAIGRAEHEASVLRADLARFETEASQLDERRDEWRERLLVIDAQLEDARHRAGLVQAQISTCETTISVATERMNSIAERAALVEREIEQLAERRVAASARLTQLAELGATDTRSGVELREREEQLAAELDVATAEFDDAAGTVEASREAFRRRTEEKAARESALASLRARRRELDARIRAADAAIAQLAGQERTEQDRVSRFEAELERLEREESERLDALETTRAQAEAARQALQAACDERARAQAALESAEARLLSLDEVEEAAGHLSRGVRAVLAARERGVLGGVVGTVADVLGVPPELERAVSAALGEWSRALVAETAEAAWAVVRYLQSERGGYAVVIPLDVLAHSEDAAELGRGLEVDGVLGRACDLVSFHTRRRRLVERLLGRTLVAADLQAARRAAAVMQGRGCVVTLAGERWDSDGTIGGGSEPLAVEDPIALTAARERLRALRDESRAALEAANAAVDRAQADLDEARGREAEAELEYREFVAEVQRVGTEAAVAAERARGASASRERHEQERNEAVIALAEADRRIAAGTEELAQLTHSATDGGEADEQAIAVAARRRDAVRAALSEVRVALSQIEERTRSRNAEIAGLQADMERVTIREADAHEELARLQCQVERQDEAARAARAELEANRERGEKVAAEVEALLQHRRSALEHAEEAERLARDARAQLPVLQARLAEQEVRRARAEEHAAGLSLRLAEELGVTLEEAEREAGHIEDLAAAQAEIRSLRGRIAQMGEVNTGAEGEHSRLAEREQFLAAQKADLEKARENLQEIIAEIDNATKVQFLEAFNAVAEQFQKVFRHFFRGGEARLVLTDPDNLLESGVEIVVKPPGRARHSLMALSGGERAITAISLLFAMLRVRPAPFAVLDEIDAALDESNTERLAQLLRAWTDQTQFIMVTHAQGTMQGCDRLYGVAMQEKGVSCCLSVSLEEAAEAAEGSTPRRARDVFYPSDTGDGAPPEESLLAG